jgi:hypothetical protein
VRLAYLEILVCLVCKARRACLVSLAYLEILVSLASLEIPARLEILVCRV